jgi:GT2 family glycosyltransferase
MNRTKSPTVTIIIVTLNSALFVAKAIESSLLQDYAEKTIVVVDNHSIDGTAAFIRHEYPAIHLIESAHNTGFAGGNNIGMKAYPADYFVLLNSDAVLAPNFVSVMVHYMENSPTTAVAGAKVFYGDRIRLQHAGGMFRDNALTYHIGEGEFDHGQYDTVREVDYVIGAAMAIRGRIAQALGYLPEAYFPAYFEEADFCYQARSAGYRVVYLPQAVAYHDERFSGSGTQSLKFIRRYHTRRFLFALRNFKTRSDRDKFLKAELEWRKKSTPGVRTLLLLTFCKLANWRYFPEALWLFRVL